MERQNKTSNNQPDQEVGQEGSQIKSNEQVEEPQKSMFQTTTIELPEFEQDQTNQLETSSIINKTVRSRVIRQKILIDNPTWFPKDIAERCPSGVIYIGEQPENASEKDLIRYWREHKSNQQATENQEAQELEYDDLFRIGRFVVHIGDTSITNLKKMRKFWPRQEYRLLKNRKTARNQRVKNKIQSSQLEYDMIELQMQNSQQAARIRELEQKLYGSCQFQTQQVQKIYEITKRPRDNQDLEAEDPKGLKRMAVITHPLQQISSIVVEETLKEKEPELVNQQLDSTSRSKQNILIEAATQTDATQPQAQDKDEVITCSSAKDQDLESETKILKQTTPVQVSCTPQRVVVAQQNSQGKFPLRKLPEFKPVIGLFSNLEKPDARVNPYLIKNMTQFNSQLRTTNYQAPQLISALNTGSPAGMINIPMIRGTSMKQQRLLPLNRYRGQQFFNNSINWDLNQQQFRPKQFTPTSLKQPNLTSELSAKQIESLLMKHVKRQQ